MRTPEMNWRFRAAILWIIFYVALLILQGCNQKLYDGAKKREPRKEVGR